MRSADYAELLEPIDGASLCGEPLDYDPGFLEFERATRAGPERQAGDQTVAGEAQDWRHVAELGVELAAFMRQAGKLSDVFCPSSIFGCAGKSWP